MVEMDVKKLAEQLDAAQAILDEIRVTSGCDAFRPLRRGTAERVKAALETAERAFRDRQARTDFVGEPEMFGEPAWDMLLDLFIRQAKDEKVSVRSACIAAHTPATTAMRWLRVLEQYGLISAAPDPADDSRRLVHLTPTGYEGMLRYLESIEK
jgi:hypothetical protein